MKFLTSVLLFVVLANVADAGWYERVVDEKYQIRVYPAPTYERCDHGALHIVQPAPYWEERTRRVRQTYWVDEPITYTTAPIYFAPVCQPTYICPPVYVCPPVYTCPQPTYWYGW